MPAPRHAGLEAVGLRHRPHGHVAAIAAACDAEALRRRWALRFLDRIDAGQNVAQIAMAESRDIARGERFALSEAAARIGQEQRVAVLELRARDRAREAAEPTAAAGPPWTIVIIGSLPFAFSGSSSQPCTSCPSLFQVMLWAVSGMVRPALACVRSCQWPMSPTSISGGAVKLSCTVAVTCDGQD